MSDDVWYRRLGDVKDYIDGRANGIADLSTVASIQPHVKQKRVKKLLTATVLDSAARTFRIQLGVDGSGWLATEATVGEWLVTVQFTFLDGGVRTWPDFGHGILMLSPQYDP